MCVFGCVYFYLTIHRELILIGFYLEEHFTNNEIKNMICKLQNFNNNIFHFKENVQINQKQKLARLHNRMKNENFLLKDLEKLLGNIVKIQS